MSIVNRRNAVLGWVAWTVGKRLARQKARDAVPAIDTKSRRPNRTAVLSLAAMIGAALWFWRRNRSGDEAGAAVAE
jgi:hypothetical protein